MDARAIQRTVRQSARKMRLVIDLIRGRAVPEADAILRFSKKRAAKQIHKVLKSAVANAQQAAQRQNEAFDADRLRVKYAVVNEGATLKRFTAPAVKAAPATATNAEPKAKSKAKAKRTTAKGKKKTKAQKRSKKASK